MTEVRYSIDSVQPRPTFTGAGKPIDVFDVVFTELSSGFSGKVSVPQLGYTAESVDAMVRPLAEQLAATARLGT